MEDEIWKDVVGFEGYYEVSNKGNVRSVDRHVPSKSRLGTVKYDFYPSQPIKAREVYGGYQQVKLNRNGKFPRAIHRLVAQAFIPNPDSLPEVNHIDGNKANNCVENLEWVNRSGNSKHAYETNLTKSGAKHHYAKLTEKLVAEILHVNNTTKLTYTLIGRLFNVCAESVSNMCRGKSWKQPHVRGVIESHLKRLETGEESLSVDINSIQVTGKNFRRRDEKRYK